MILSVRNKNVLDCTTVPVKTTFIPNLYPVVSNLEWKKIIHNTQIF